MQQAVMVENSGKFTVMISKEGLGRYSDYYFLVKDGFWSSKGGPFGSEREARQAAYEAISKATVGSANL